MLRNLSRFAHASCLLAAPLVSQTSVVSPRADYAVSEGGSVATLFGAFAEGRHQIADGNLRGRSLTIQAIDMRHDHRNYVVGEGGGRRWGKVVVTMADCQFGSVLPTFANNATSTPKTVFDGTLTWPTAPAIPASLPASWSLSLPMTTAYAYSGSADLLMDFTFTGGTLTNGAPWPAGTAVPYALDSFSFGDEVSGNAVYIGNIAGGCADSGAPSQAGAFLHLDTAAFGPNHPNPALQDRAFLEVTGSNFGARQSAFLVLAFGADVPGLPFPGVTCNRLHVPLTRAWFLYPVRTNAIGNIQPFTFGIFNGLLPYTQSWLGINMFLQGVWNDTRTGALRISAGVRNGFMAQPPERRGQVRMRSVFDSDPMRAVAREASRGNPADTPILRYR